MEPWFWYVMSAMVCYGGIDFLHKAAAVADSPSRIVVRTTAIVVALLSLAGVILTGSGFENWRGILLYAAINSTFFALGSMARITALKKLPAAYVFPVAKTSAVLLILISVIFLGDRPDVSQWAGIVLSVGLVVWVGRGLARDNSAASVARFPHEHRMAGFILALASASCTTITVTTGKFASSEVPHLSFMLVSYGLVVVHTFVIEWLFLRNKPERHVPVPDTAGATAVGDAALDEPSVALASAAIAREPVPGRSVAKRIAGQMRQTSGRLRRVLRADSRHVRRAIMFGSGIGTLNFAGYLLILQAFAGGPLALIQGISSTSFVIPIILSALVFGEKLDARRGVVVALAVVSVVLQR